MGWPAYLIRNASGQKRYPTGANREWERICSRMGIDRLWPDFNPNAAMFAPHQYGAVIVSDTGIVLWLAGVLGSIYTFGFWTVFRLYLVPYLW